MKEDPVPAIEAMVDLVTTGNAAAERALKGDSDEPQPEKRVMTIATSFRVLIATDRSPFANAAVATAAVFPWPRGLTRQVAAAAQRALAGRWADAHVSVPDGDPVV